MKTSNQRERHGCCIAARQGFGQNGFLVGMPALVTLPADPPPFEPQIELAEDEDQGRSIVAQKKQIGPGRTPDESHLHLWIHRS